MKKRSVFFFIFILFSFLFAEEQLLNKMVVRVNGKVYTIYDCKKLLRFDDPASVNTQAVLDRKDKLIDQLIELGSLRMYGIPGACGIIPERM